MNTKHTNTMKKKPRKGKESKMYISEYLHPKFGLIAENFSSLRQVQQHVDFLFSKRIEVLVFDTITKTNIAWNILVKKRWTRRIPKKNCAIIRIYVGDNMDERIK